MEPITRKEIYLAKLAGEYESEVPAPITRVEKYMAAAAGAYSEELPEPITRQEIYWAHIAGVDISVPAPITREEQYLYSICGHSITTPHPITRVEQYLQKLVGSEPPSPKYDPVLENNSWEQIVDACNNNRIPDTWKIGDTKLLDLGSEGVVDMQIVGFGTDEKANGNGHAPITWMSKELIATSHRMNPALSGNEEGTGAIGGWEKSEMRSYVKDTVKPLIPDNVRDYIIEVKKYSKTYDNSGSAVNNAETHDDVWIPSCREIFGGTNYETQGAIYNMVFNSATMRQKMKVNGSSAINWWLRTAGATVSFRYVNSNGSNTGGYVGNLQGIALCFCT